MLNVGHIGIWHAASKRDGERELIAAFVRGQAQQFHASQELLFNLSLQMRVVAPIGMDPIKSNEGGRAQRHGFVRL